MKCPGESVSLVINKSLMGQDSGGVCQGAHFIQNIMTLNMIPCLLLPCVMLPGHAIWTNEGSPWERQIYILKRLWKYTCILHISLWEYQINTKLYGVGISSAFGSYQLSLHNIYVLPGCKFLCSNRKVVGLSTNISWENVLEFPIPS